MTLAATERLARGCVAPRSRRASAFARGQRFGELTIVESLGVKAGRLLWLLQCDCGGHVVRSSGDLRASKNTGCRRCIEEERRGRSVAAARSGAFADLWRHTGGLYEPAHIAHFTREIREACASELGVCPDERVPRALDVQPIAETPTELLQRDAYLFPVEASGGAWACATCGALVLDRCFGCMGCGRGVCSNCVRGSWHRCQREISEQYGWPLLVKVHAQIIAMGGR